MLHNTSWAYGLFLCSSPLNSLSKGYEIVGPVKSEPHGQPLKCMTAFSWTYKTGESSCARTRVFILVSVCVLAEARSNGGEEDRSHVVSILGSDCSLSSSMLWEIKTAPSSLSGFFRKQALAF